MRIHFAALVLTTAGAATAATAPGPLDWALRFATGIQSDVKDREQAEEAVVLDLAIYGSVDDAVARVPKVEGWRKGVALAEIAKVLVRKGRVGDARTLIDRAREVLSGLPEGWERPRVESHILQATALLGEEVKVDAAEKIVTTDDLQYEGLPAILRAEGLAVRGDATAALSELSAMEKEPSIEMAWPMTQAYLEIARHPDVPRERKSEALEAARRKAAAIQEGITRIDSMQLVADALVENGSDEAARSTLDDVEKRVERMSDQAVLKGPFLAGAARARSRLGDRKEALELLTRAVQAAEKSYVLDRPAIWANVAAGYHVAGDAAKAASTLRRAFDEADALQNARPRALAYVEIGRAMGRFGLPMTDDTRGRFERGLAELKAPW